LPFPLPEAGAHTDAGLIELVVDEPDAASGGEPKLRGELPRHVPKDG
jgi:hypothetical protein